MSVRYENDRDMVYVRLRWLLRQEYSTEIEQLDEDVILDASFNPSPVTDL